MEGEPEMTRGTASPGASGPDPQPHTAVPAEPMQTTGATNPRFMEEPPPYSPPDPKTAHLLYPPFQTNVPGQGPAFYQPTSFPTHNGSQFVEIPLEADQRQPPPKDYMVESFLAMTFCCLVTGVFALIYSNEARAAVSRGDLTWASIFSQKARAFIRYSLVLGLFTSACWVIYVVLYLYL